MESNIVGEQQKRLEEEKKDKIDGSINHFDRLNLLPSTNLMYVKHAFLNKLSMEANEKLTMFSIEDMNTTIKGYLALSNREKSEKYIKNLEAYNQKKIDAAKIMYAQKLAAKKHSAQYHYYVTKSQIEWLIEVGKTKYSINYEVDFSNVDNETFIQLLRNIYDSLSRKKQDYLINGNSDEKFVSSLKEVIDNLKDIIDTCKVDKFKKETSLIKKIY